jgi:molecular chaperone GrpE
MKKNDKKIEQEENELENQLRRSLADYQNLEKRISEEKSNWILSANKDLILRLLPGLDSLLLALKHTNDEGVRLSVKHFLDIFEREGVQKIVTENSEFDPNLMEAVGTAPGEEGIIVEEVRPGYTLNNSVIRPAQVIVGSAEQNQN